jgi:hypothetical protein
VKEQLLPSIELGFKRANQGQGEEMPNLAGEKRFSFSRAGARSPGFFVVWAGR